MITGIFLIDFIGVVVALITIYITYLKLSWTYWEKKGIPTIEPSIPLGSFSNPVTRNKMFAEYIAENYHEMRLKGHKHVGLYSWHKPIYMVLDLEYLKNIVSKDFHHFVDRGIYYNEKYDPLSAHLFAIGGTKWKNLRRKLTPTFTSGKMRSMFNILVDCGKILDKIMSQLDKKQEPIDIKDVLGRFTTDIIGSCAFGLECHTAENENSPFRVYGKKVFQQTKLKSLQNSIFINFPLLGKLVGFKQISEDVSNFFMKVVSDAVNYREKNNVVRKDFLQLLIDLKKGDNGEKNEGDGNSLTLNEIAAQCFVFFIAGFETSSTAMTFALYEMSKNQDIQDKVREEIDTVLKKYNGEITYDAINDMKYMGQVLDESLRMYPPVPLITRKCVLDYKIPDTNIVIEKGTMVFIPIYGIHYDPEYYPEPKKFDPERFSEANKHTIKQFSHIPFGEGNRICIGLRFGLMQSKVGLITLLRKYRFTVNPKTIEPIQTNPRSFVTSALGEVWLNCRKI